MTARAAFFCVVPAAFASCCAAARAETDFCPASVQAIKPAGSPAPAGPATQFRYALGARSERVVESASMIADTDRGWYAWNVADIPIGKNLRSDSLRVTFPQELTIRHAWVTAAALSTKTEFPWNATAFDAAGLRAARLSTYAPAISYCQPVLGEYLFTASFQGRH